MATINVTQPSDGDAITAASVNDQINAILAQANGNLDSDNLAANAVGTSELTNGSVTVAKLGTDVQSGWISGVINAPTTVTNNGNRSYDLVFNSVDYTQELSEGMRLKLTRTVTAPTQSTSLNGTTQYWSKSSPAGTTFTDDFCAGAWVYLTSYANAGIISRYNGTSGWILYISNTGQVTFNGYNAGSGNLSQVVSSQSIPLNKWVHIAAQLDMSAFTATTTTSYVMIDGVDVPCTVARAGTNPTALVQAGSLEVGSYNAGTSPFPGKIAQAWYSSAKITQANIRTFMSQGITASDISTHSIVSAFSFNGVATDLNTTNANNLSATASAGYTSDSPFAGGSGSYYTAGTTEIAQIIAKPTFSTNTTVTVRTQEGCVIPTSGGVSAVSYSTQRAPYGASSDVTTDDLNLSGAQTNSVLTTQTTTSTSYTDLSTVGPTVTVNVGPSGMVLISVGARGSSSSAGGWWLMSYAASGANTISASDNYAAGFRCATASDEVVSYYTKLLTGLTPGITTFTCKYRAVAGTATILIRNISVVPL